MMMHTQRPFASRILNGARKEGMFSEQTNGQMRWEILDFQNFGIIIDNNNPSVKSKPVHFF